MVDGVTGPFASLRNFNRRSNDWGQRHPWLFAALFGAAHGGGHVGAALASGYPLRWPVPAVAAGASFLVLGTAGWFKARRGGEERPAVRDPVTTRPTDLTLRGDGGGWMEQDGRRWRSGAP